MNIKITTLVKAQLAFSMLVLIAMAGVAQSQAADTTPPKITLNGSAIQGFGLRDNYREEGAMVNDAVDGNLFDALKITGDLIDTPYAGEYKFAGGKVIATGVSGYLLPFVEKPGGFKNGNAEVKLYFKSSSSPLNYGFLNFDNGISYFFTFIARGNQMLGNLSQDKPVRKYIGTFVVDYSKNSAGEYYGSFRVLSGTVDTSKPGAYFVRYNATDNAGNAAQEVVRKVVVFDTGSSSDETTSNGGSNGENPITPPVQTPNSGPAENGGDQSGASDAWSEQEVQLQDAPNPALVTRLAGRILLQVDEHGEAWYVDGVSRNKYYLKDGSAAYEALRKFGLGITNADLAKIPVGIEKRFEYVDTDQDGLGDKMEEALGTDVRNPDTDSDGVSDGTEVLTQKTNPLGSGSLASNVSLVNKLRGKILLQVESKGEAWYVNPVDGQRYYMNNGDAAYQIMRFLSLGVSNTDLRKIPVGSF